MPAALVVALLALLVHAAVARPPAGDTPSRSLGRADRFVDRVVDGRRISFMYGNVFIDRDTVTASADTGIVYNDRDLYELRGNVRLTSREGVLTCRRALHDRQLASGDFFGDVRVEEGEVVGTGIRGESRRAGRDLRLIGNALLVTPEYSVRADTIFRDRLTGFGEAFGSVRIMEPGSSNLVTGGHAVFLADEDLAEVDVYPVLTSHGQSDGPLVSTAGLMRFYREEDRVVMVDSVRIRQARMRARADTAVALGRERLVLTGEPQVSQGKGSIMYGRQIEFIYLDGALQRVILVGEARMEDAAPDSLAAIYSGLPGMDVLEGDSISIEFEEEEIRRSVVVGRARSRYTPLDLTDEVATNDVSGDTIVLHFRDDQVQRVEVRGNMEGVYTFAKVAAMEEALGRSRRLADLLAEADSADGGATVDSLVAAATDSARLAAVDSLAREMGLDLPAVPAETVVRPALVDSLLTAALDSLALAGLDTSRSDLDFVSAAQVVQYAGHELNFEMRDRKIDILGDGELKFDTMVLTARHIKLDTDERELYAEGQPLVEDSETIAGERMGYNFRHKTGAVNEGVTSFDNYYYVGDDINRFEDTTMKIRGGRMSSCDLADPHYHFWSDRMKMRMDDKVAAAPVVMHVGHMPVFALPFYYKSLKRGRQSGILFPSFDFGWSSRDGRYIRDMGYYWATNDYMDFIFEADYNERRDVGFRVINGYRKRYAFSGGVDYSRTIGLGDSDVDQWQFRWFHDQPVLFDDYTFRSDVSMSSTKLTSNDLAGSSRRQIKPGQLRSNITTSRRWSFMNGSLNASREERVNAEDDDPSTDNLLYNMTLPSTRFRFNQISLLPQSRGPGQGSFLGQLGRRTNFSHDYTLQFTEQGNELSTNRRYNVGGNWGLRVQAPRLWIFNISANGNASQSWERKEFTGEQWITLTDTTGFLAPRDSVFEDTTPGLSTGASMNTALFGIFPIELGAVRAIRHQFRASAGWNLRPGLSGHQNHSSSYTFSVGNRFDVKYVSRTDTTATEKKLDGVVDWDLSTSFNPGAEPELQWQDISSGLLIRPGQARYLQFRVDNTIDPDKLAITSTRFNYGLNFKGRMDIGEVAPPPEEERNTSIDRLGLPDPALADTLVEDDPFAELEAEERPFDQKYERPDRAPRKKGKDLTENGRYIPFDFGTSLSYSYRNETRAKNATANVNLRLNITRNWEFRYDASFNLVDNRPVQQRYSLHRDLHCWRLEFNRTVNDVDSQFGFRLYLTSIPDLKFARGREDYMGGVGGGFF